MLGGVQNSSAMFVYDLVVSATFSARNLVASTNPYFLVDFGITCDGACSHLHLM